MGGKRGGFGYRPCFFRLPWQQQTLIKAPARCNIPPSPGNCSRRWVRGGVCHTSDRSSLRAHSDKCTRHRPRPLSLAFYQLPKQASVPAGIMKHATNHNREIPTESTQSPTACGVGSRPTCCVKREQVKTKKLTVVGVVGGLFTVYLSTKKFRAVQNWLQFHFNYA